MSKSKQCLTMRYYKIEINKTEWEVPDRYQMLTPVGLGAYGQVWYCILFFNFFFYKSQTFNKSQNIFVTLYLALLLTIELD